RRRARRAGATPSGTPGRRGTPRPRARREPRAARRGRGPSGSAAARSPAQGNASRGGAGRLARMERTPEPEVMDDAEQARAYAEADFGDANQRFVERCLPLLAGVATVVDLGCGPADIPIRLARALPRVQVVGADAS